MQSVPVGSVFKFRPGDEDCEKLDDHSYSTADGQVTQIGLDGTPGTVPVIVPPVFSTY